MLLIFEKSSRGYLFQIAYHVITFAKLLIHNLITFSPFPPCIKTTDFSNLLAFSFFFFGGESVISITSVGFW